MGDYTVTVSNTFEADSHEDAVAQMVAWLLDNAGQVGYRVTRQAPSECDSVFIDAERIGIV